MLSRGDSINSLFSSLLPFSFTIIQYDILVSFSSSNWIFNMDFRHDNIDLGIFVGILCHLIEEVSTLPLRSHALLLYLVLFRATACLKILERMLRCTKKYDTISSKYFSVFP